MTMSRYQNILCPTDFSEGSLAALEEALCLAEAFDAKITLLHVWQLPTVAVADGFIWPQDLWSRVGTQVEAAARQRMQRLLDTLSEARRRRITERVLCGDAASTILEQAAELATDLIVMGTHGRRGPSRFLMGSVAERVVRHAPCPVLTVRRGHVESATSAPLGASAPA
jgi:nucleotide-binding universal stress UspA family protein